MNSRKGIYEYLLDGEQHPELLEVRLFDDKTKALAHKRQTDAATAVGTSNCPVCAIGENANKTRIYKPTEMDADHVAAWSKGAPPTSPTARCLRPAQPRQGQQVGRRRYCLAARATRRVIG